MNAATQELLNLKRRLMAEPPRSTTQTVLLGLGLFGLGLIAGAALRHFDAGTAVKKLYSSVTQRNGKYPVYDDTDLDQNLGIGA